MRCHNAFFYLATAVAVSPFPGLGVAAPAAGVGRALPKVQHFFSSGFEDVVAPGCRLAVEDASHGEGYIGNVKISVPRWMRSEVAHAPIFIQRGSPPKPVGRTLGARELATFLRKRLPRRWSIHLGGASRQVVVIALKKLQRWKRNPLSRRITITGVYTIAQVEKRFIKKACPRAKVSLLIPPMPGTGGNPAAPNLKLVQTPLRFDIKDMTLRHFLTSGFGGRLEYMPAAFGGGELIWEADFETKKGRFLSKFNLTIYLYGARLAPSEVVHPRKPKPSDGNPDK